MRNKNIDGNLVETIREMLNMATMSDGRNTTKTSIGSMQGSCLSPLLFAYYINDMLKEMQANAYTLALADDLAAHCDGELRLTWTINLLEKHCRHLGLKINKAKSGIMLLRVSQRQKYPEW